MITTGSGIDSSDQGTIDIFEFLTQTTVGHYIVLTGTGFGMFFMSGVLTIVVDIAFAVTVTGEVEIASEK